MTTHVSKRGTPYELLPWHSSIKWRFCAHHTVCHGGAALSCVRNDCASFPSSDDVISDVGMSGDLPAVEHPGWVRGWIEKKVYVI